MKTCPCLYMLKSMVKLRSKKETSTAVCALDGFVGLVIAGIHLVVLVMTSVNMIADRK